MMLDTPAVVMETHGGAGRLYSRCYAHVLRGVVFEMDEAKADILAEQRPSWSVYQADCAPAIAAGVGSHLPVNVLDCDPYGQPWPAIEAFFGSRREFTKQMVLVVNDGTRHNIKVTGGWNVESLRPAVEHFGNVLGKRYLEVCEWMVKRVTAKAGYDLRRWTAYYTGARQAMTHYAALLER